MKRLRTTAWLVLAGGLLSAGCRMGQPRQGSPAGNVEGKFGLATGVTTAGQSTASLVVFADPTPSRRSFLQYDTGRRGAAPRGYERVVSQEGRVEGGLIGRIEFPLNRYLDPHSRNAGRPRVDWPSAQRGGVDAFFVEFHPAVMEWPVEAVEGGDVSSGTRMTAYGGDGVPFAYGTCRRTMRFVARESIRSGEETFDDAIRMEADTELSFGWMATVRVHETAWFARGVGLVRREERYSGRALWLFRFGGASRYELADDVKPRVEMVSDEANGISKSKGDPNGHVNLTRGETDQATANENLLSRIAICFERSGRRVRLCGLAAEYTERD